MTLIETLAETEEARKRDGFVKEIKCHLRWYSVHLTLQLITSANPLATCIMLKDMITCRTYWPWEILNATHSRLVFSNHTIQMCWSDFFCTEFDLRRAVHRLLVSYSYVVFQLENFWYSSFPGATPGIFPWIKVHEGIVNVYCAFPQQGQSLLTCQKHL